MDTSSHVHLSTIVRTRCGRAAALIALLTLSSPVIASFDKPGPWSGFMGTNDLLVEWQRRTVEYADHSARSCDIQFIIIGEGAANFHWWVTYQKDPGGELGQRDNPAYNVTRDKPFEAQILGCREVQTARIDRVTRRGVGGGNGGGLKPKEGDSQKVGPGVPPKKTPSEGGLKPPPGVIVFPGSFRAPSLGAVSMDATSLQWVLGDSHRLNNKLLDWRPMRQWAGHGTPTVQQADWDALSKLLTRVDKPTLRSLAAESSQHAAIYPATSTLGRFWKTLAAFYQHQSEK